LEEKRREIIKEWIDSGGVKCDKEPSLVIKVTMKKLYLFLLNS
jgi:hypothetical protein